MQFKENINDTYTFHPMAIGMHEYNWSLGNPNKKALKASKFEIRVQVARRGRGA
jgi:hypothetical protein